MKTINRKKLVLALAGITAIGAAGSVGAVQVSPTGLGGLLFYPYYTVKGEANPYNTLLSIVNTTNSTKAVKVRFREGKASVEVLDFNVFLSPYDMWTASLEPIGGANGGVRLFTNDRSCTIPNRLRDDGFADFRSTSYQGDEVEDNSLTRLREGYFEVIEMATYSEGSTVHINALHANGEPEDCTKINSTVAFFEGRAPQGGLSGTASLVAPGTGLNAATDAVALENFVNPNGQNIYFGTGSDEPTINNGDGQSNTPTGDGNTVHALWTGLNAGADAVSAALMKQAIINEFVLDAGTASQTDWIITFPTKWFYVDHKSGADPEYLFTSPMTSTGSCDKVVITYWDREERTETPSGEDFSPAPDPDEIDLCWEANVLTFNNKNIFSSSQTLTFDALFTNGWARMDFFPDNDYLVADTAQLVIQNQNTPVTVTGTSPTFTGLPVIGFAVQTFRPSLVSSYAGTFYHRFIPGTSNNAPERPAQ